MSASSFGQNDEIIPNSRSTTPRPDGSASRTPTRSSRRSLRGRSPSCAPASCPAPRSSPRSCATWTGRDADGDAPPRRLRDQLSPRSSARRRRAKVARDYRTRASLTREKTSSRRRYTRFVEPWREDSTSAAASGSRDLVRPRSHRHDGLGRTHRGSHVLVTLPLDVSRRDRVHATAAGGEEPPRRAHGLRPLREGRSPLPEAFGWSSATTSSTSRRSGSVPGSTSRGSSASRPSRC